MPNFVDPLRSIFIRQEAALRKLDAIIVKVSQVDSLESKLEGMQKLLEEQLEKNNVLETKLEVLEEKLLEHQLEQYKILEVKLETIETKLHERSLAVNHTLEVELEALATKLQENQLETNLMIENKLETIDVKLEDVLNAVKNTSLNCTEVGAQIMHTQEKLRETCQSNTDENEEVVTIFRNINETSSESLLNYTTDISHLSDKAMHEIKSFVENTVTNIIFPTHLRDNDAMGINTEISHKLTNLSDLITSHINITKHLFAATFNRIAVSNLAMDKRLGALLHTSSSRQRVLQDSLLTAIASLSPVIKTQTQEVIRKTESKLGSLELSLASSVKRHAKELATQVLEAANVTLNDVYMNTMARLTDLYQAHINQSLLLENNFNLMNELKNLTFHRQQSNENYDLCLDAIGEDDQNETTKYTLRALSRIEDVVSIATVFGRC
ncbi:hypothetical protein SK128_007106 [Halocaridina rubra]|uniref:Uncharacterized protein n=1 Tax=Halocaridina rubra TaxID=373956 RepID=A0AAN9AB40_HALRR